MKKILLAGLIGIIALIAFLIPNYTYADMGAPVILTYSVYVTNTEGINYYVSNDSKMKIGGKYNYGEKIEIIDEYEEDGEMYGIVSWTPSTRYIKLADVSKVAEVYNNYDETRSENFTVLAEDGVEIYSGPAYGYESTGITIPKGTEIKGYYAQKDVGDNPWFYVTYNGISGWICELNGVLGFESEYARELKMPVDRNIYKDNSCTTGLGAIPANTIITDILDVDQWSQNFYVTYNGVSGYISKYDCAVISNENYNTYTVYFDGTKMYEKASTQSEVVNENIEKGTVLKSQYDQYDIRSTGWIYTEYNGQKGWVAVIGDDYFKDDYNSYEELVSSCDCKEEDILDYITEEKESQETNNAVENEVENKTQQVGNNTTESENVITLSPTQLVIICVIVAVVFSLTTLVIIVLVNKK